MVALSSALVEVAAATSVDPSRSQTHPAEGVGHRAAPRIIPTLDAASRELRECLHNIHATVNVSYEIIVVDNGSLPQGFSAPVKPSAATEYSWVSNAAASC
jgi:hypothetical protein